MIIIRYSKTAFKPQFQNHHLSNVDYELNHFDEYMALCPEHLKRVSMERHERIVQFYTENLDDLQYGIWVFIDGHKNNQSLNHLKERVPCWIAELPDDTLVYSVNWDKKILLSDDLVKAFGCYIPASQLNNLRNIRRFKKCS